MSAAKKLALPILAISAGVGLMVANLEDPPGAEECSLITVVRDTDAGLVLETVDVCGEADGGVATGEEFVREVSHGPKRARNGKAIGLHRHQPSGCACSQGAGCERLTHGLDGSQQWVPAPLGSVMQEGEHRGCVPVVSCYDVSELPLGSNLAPECQINL